MKVVIIGNIGSGKRVMAEQLIGTKDIALLPLDELSGACAQTGHSLEEGLRILWSVLDGHTDWVVESANGDLAEAVLPYCDELRFINAEEHESADIYKYREDAYGLARHRELFDKFEGPKETYSCTA